MSDQDQIQSEVKEDGSAQHQENIRRANEKEKYDKNFSQEIESYLEVSPKKVCLVTVTGQKGKGKCVKMKKNRTFVGMSKNAATQAYLKKAQAEGMNIKQVFA